MNDSTNNVSFLAHESDMNRLERANRRSWIMCLILIVALIATNAAWIYYESQWQYTEEKTEIEAEQEGDVNIIGGGDVNYGAESKSE